MKNAPLVLLQTLWLLLLLSSFISFMFLMADVENDKFVIANNDATLAMYRFAVDIIP